MPYGKWKIRVSGYGTFDFEGTEHQAEEMRAHKANWEQGTALKWRTDGLAKPSDLIRAKMAQAFDDSGSCSFELTTALRKAKRKEEKANKLTKILITEEQSRLIHHTLGVTPKDKVKKPYRNHFVTSKDTEAYSVFKKLVVRKLATEGERFNQPVFWITLLGAQKIGVSTRAFNKINT